MSEAKQPVFFKGLKSREGGKAYPAEVLYVCEEDFSPLEVDYDYDAIAKVLTKDVIESRMPNMWRYKELLPVAGPVTVGQHVGFTPLVKADRLAKKLGIREIWVKNDTVNTVYILFQYRHLTTRVLHSISFNKKKVGTATAVNW